MGNSKLPSQSCHACRPRQAKCDRARPGCTQCARKFVKCPGYLDLADLRVQDETQNVMRKAQKRTSLLKTCSPGAPSSGPTAEARSSSSPLLPAPAGPGEESGNRNADSSTCNKGGAANITIQQYCGVDTLKLTNPALDALRATSLAYLSMTLPPSLSPTFTRTTTVTYGLVLSHTNASLADPSTAAADMTLLAVLLLALFESLSLRGPSSRTAWLAHARGTQALLRLRRRQRRTNDSSPGRELDRLAARQVRVSGILRAEQVQFKNEEFRGEEVTAAELRNDGLLDHIIKLRLLENLHKGIGHDLEAVRRTMELDAGIDSRATARLPRPGPGPEYARAARSWITMRIVRLFLNHKLQSQDLDSDDATAIRGVGRQNSEQVAAEILAMVPELLKAARGGSDLAMVARHLIWPLALFASSNSCPAPGRECLLKQLKEITHKWNLLPPAEAARLLEGSKHPGDWCGVLPRYPWPCHV